MAQLWKVRLPDGKVLTPGDWTAAEPLWSQVELQAGPFPILRAFSYGAGGSVPGSPGPRDATDLDTNLEGEGSRLPENEELVIYNLGVTCFKVGPALNVDAFPDADNPGVPLPDMIRMQRDLIVLFRIASVKDYTHSPLSYWPSGTGVQGLYAGGRSKVSGAVATGEVVAYNGGVSRYDMRHFASPLYVAGGETFYVDFEGSVGRVEGLNLAENSRIVLRTYLDGYRRRPVA
jgi:hypothetical protein